MYFNELKNKITTRVEWTVYDYCMIVGGCFVFNGSLRQSISSRLQEWGEKGKKHDGREKKW